MPIVIAHRGASGYRPEHTLAAYELGARQGADYIEPDLVSTADGHLVARHENEIAGTTDVADHPELAARRTTTTIDGAERTGWFTDDLTLAEVRTLRARERIPELRPANAEHDGRHGIPTLQEVIDLAARLTRELGRPIGIYPETKHPSHHRDLGLPLEPRLVEVLRRNELDGPGAPVFVQSFEPWSLQALREQLGVPLVQLLAAGAGERATPDGLRAIAAYADAVGPAKRLVDRPFVEAAHAAGLLVHPYTFRRENAFLPPELRSGDDPTAPGDLEAELRRFYGLGVDGVFCDHPDVAAMAR